MTRAAMLALVALLAGPAIAEAPKSQILRLVDGGLRQHGIHTDVSKLTVDQTAALHLELSTNDEDDIRTRDALIAILNRNPETEVKSR